MVTVRTYEHHINAESITSANHIRVHGKARQDKKDIVAAPEVRSSALQPKI
jgi:hypothetical protein